MAEAPDTGASGPLPTAEQLARVWARAVADTSFVPMDHKTIVVFLRGLADSRAGREGV